MVAPSVARLPGPVVRVADHTAAGAPGHHDVVRFSAPLDTLLTEEFNGALICLRISADVLLLAALGRAVQRTFGERIIAVDMADGVFAGRQAILRCVSARDTHATATLLDADRILALSAVREGGAGSQAEICLSRVGTPAHLGAERALQLSAHRQDGILHLDWWYDRRRFDEYTVVELAEQFPLALIELTSEAVGPLHGSDNSPVAHWAFAG
ncbi:MAG: hypothetical protein ABWY45_03075 [Mycobacterium sp.]